MSPRQNETQYLIAARDACAAAGDLDRVAVCDYALFCGPVERAECLAVLGYTAPAPAPPVRYSSRPTMRIPPTTNRELVYGNGPGSGRV